VEMVQRGRKITSSRLLRISNYIRIAHKTSTGALWASSTRTFSLVGTPPKSMWAEIQRRSAFTTWRYLSAIAVAITSELLFHAIGFRLH